MPRYNHVRLRALRNAAQLSQEEVGRRLGKATSTIVRYERGVIVPTARVVGMLAAIYDVPVGDLYDPDDPDDAVTVFDAELRVLVDAAPPLTEAQKAQLRVLLRPSPGGGRAA